MPVPFLAADAGVDHESGGMKFCFQPSPQAQIGLDFTQSRAASPFLRACIHVWICAADKRRSTGGGKEWVAHGET